MPVGEVRITLRLQWDTTITSVEGRMDAIHLAEAPARTFPQLEPFWEMVVTKLNEHSVRRLLDQMEV